MISIIETVQVSIAPTLLVVPIIEAVRDTPISTLLIVSGLFFVLLGFVESIGTIITISPGQKKWSVLIGLFVLSMGLVFHLSASPGSIATDAENTEATEVESIQTTEVEAVEVEAIEVGGTESIEVKGTEPVDTKAAEDERCRLPSPYPGEVEAIINDPDGYTNVRGGADINYPVSTRVRDYEFFYVVPDPNREWWPVRTACNVEGYMHRSRVDLNPPRKL